MWYVIILPTREDKELFVLGDEKIFKLLSHLHNMCDAVVYRGITMHEHNTNDLCILPVPNDQSLYVRKSSGIKQGESIRVC